MYVILALHVDCWPACRASCSWASIGLLLLVAVVSGVVLYAPFMRKLEFGTVRRDRRAPALARPAQRPGHRGDRLARRGQRLRRINTWADLVIELLAVRPARGDDAPYTPPSRRWRSPAVSCRRARHAAGGRAVDGLAFVAFPGCRLARRTTTRSSCVATTPLTSRCSSRSCSTRSPASSPTGASLPWSLTAILILAAAAFRDYGGLAEGGSGRCDLVTIAAPASGSISVWRRSPVEAIAELERLGSDDARLELLVGARPRSACSAACGRTETWWIVLDRARHSAGHRACAGRQRELIRASMRRDLPE